MSITENWLDKTIRRVCEWFDDLFPGGHAVATVGHSLAGMSPRMPMPVDRTWRPPTEIFDSSNVATMADKSHIKTGIASPESNCNFWAYCHIDARLCVWCGGKNSISPANPKHKNFVDAGKDLCPSGTTAGGAWFGCCRNPTSKVAKYIAFMDCCGPQDPEDCGKGKPWCEKWLAAKDWCQYGGNKSSYYCTSVIDYDYDKGCQ